MLSRLLSTRPGCWRQFRLQRFLRRGPRLLLRKGVGLLKEIRTAEENEIFATIPTTKLMVETLELQSRALMASRTVVDELERVTTVTIPRLKKDVTEATQATKMSTEKVERLKVQLEEKQTTLKAQDELTKSLEAQLLSLIHI